MNIRPMRIEDYEAVTEVWRSAGLDFQPEGRESRESITRQMSAYGGLMLVAESDGRVVGVVIGSHDHRKGWINRMAIHPQWQRQGVARMLGQRLFEEFEKLDIHIIAATIYDHNAASRSLAERMGFMYYPEVTYYSRRSRPVDGTGCREKC